MVYSYQCLTIRHMPTTAQCTILLPTYGIYVLKLVLEWIKEQGGVKALQEINEKKAKILYDYLDSSKMFKGTVVPEDRSLMNCTVCNR